MSQNRKRATIKSPATPISVPTNGYANLGQHMTPLTIAKQMAEFVRRPVAEWNVIDPACGDGNLLLAVIDAMEAAGVPDIAQRVTGIDIDPKMAGMARTRLSERLKVGVDAIRVFNEDFMEGQESTLFDRPTIDYSAFNVLISNPPYGQNREYAFFQLANHWFSRGTELVFLMPLAFLDRVSGVQVVPLNGRPMGVTTGHAIVYHRAGEDFDLRSVKENQTNSTPFCVLTGVKLYELGGGTPAQVPDTVATKPFSSDVARKGWIPCLRTGDVHAFEYSLGRLFVKYGEHLAHPKDLGRFQGPRLVLRRVPIWESRQLGAAYIEETALCAGDMLVVRHADNDPTLLKGLCVFLNSPTAAEYVLSRRPSIRYRDSYPKFSAKDINALLESGTPSIEQLRVLATQFPSSETGSAKPLPKSVLIDHAFPVEAISACCTREKSTRHGHISTLQMWWARRPLAVCRSAIFASLVPALESSSESEFARLVNELIPGNDPPAKKLINFTARLAEWKTCEDEHLQGVARRLIAAANGSTARVADTFAGGGSFPIEATRLGLDAYGSDLNPVAVAALKVALELLPSASSHLLPTFQTIGKGVQKRLKSFTKDLYGHSETETVLAFFWCRTYRCPQCNFEVPLLKNRILRSSGEPVIVNLSPNDKRHRFEFSISTSVDAKQLKAAGQATVGGRGAVCPACSHRVATSYLQEQCREQSMGDRLYAKRVMTAAGAIRYEHCTPADEARASNCTLRPLRGRRQRELPNEPFDANGVRHLWAMQYGIKTTADLFNCRQGIALLEVQAEIERAFNAISDTDLDVREQDALRVLLVLILNRLVMYNSRHSWWQPNGEFPANIFVRQAIPMVWSYVEMPVDSPAAGGFSSAFKWISLVADHCRKLPRRGTASMADAAHCELADASVDVMTLDPPYYDAIVYAYLSDVFYVWMRPLLKSVFPDLFREPVTPKAEEAIVDRPHKMAPTPKGDKHFRRKMTEAFSEVRRVLKPSGRLLLMFGHKKAKAWDAVVSALFEAGLTPIVSWPVHTERKSKLRHGHIAALSTSCILVCKPGVAEKKPDITWNEFEPELQSVLQPCIRSCRSNHLYGTDLFAATVAPALSVFKRYCHINENDAAISVDAFLKRLPRLIARCEFDTLLADGSLQKHKAATRWLKDLHRAHETCTNGVSLEAQSDGDGGLVSIAARYSDALLAGAQHEADEIWERMRETDRAALRVFFEATSLVSDDSSNLRQRADASLGRIGMRLRSSPTRGRT